MVGHLTQQRTMIQESSQSPLETLVAFLNSHLAQHADRRRQGIEQPGQRGAAPTDALVVRNELDTNTIYVSRTAIMAYCADQRIAFKPLEQTLGARTA
jgi:hypothetical protein